MKSNLLYLIFGIISIILIISLILVLKSVNPKDIQISKIIDEKVESIKKVITNNDWYLKLANTNSNDFFPISNELYIHFELQDTGNLSKKKFFKLNIDKSDTYSMFCVKQTISNLNLKYFLINNKKYSQIVIDTNNISLLHYLVDSLKSYNINSNFEEIWI